MAQRVTHVLVSDLTNEEMEPGEGQTVTFALDGVEFTIDLFDDQAEALREAFAPYVAAGRRTGGRAKQGTGRPSNTTSASREFNQAVRAWANQNGYDLAERGRIPGHVVQAYNERTKLAAAS